ncbi:hypothetical protein [Desulfuribacillus alkaliarsenatis]|uniref:Uncharacterized protein n=1 Tax=Desulfuribacillus alkaliarsenatis TaxID=766136 RepID=A0A1E5G2H0_9FIRM|nr:hypothetical protein [Desulfuribacillus alkaliarsenatis]OEF97175.1 hypothetical protein BHF68_06150 [Desulfuribacillus alkaliarsenatis]
MLGKLIKLDIQFAYRKFLTMAAILIAFGIVMPYLYDTVVQAGVAFVFSVSLFTVGVMCVWLILQHFKRNLFGDEGYLMFSLPVKPYQLLLSKLITTVLWFNLILICTIIMVSLMARSQVSMDFVIAFMNWRYFTEAVKGIVAINLNVIPMILAIYMGIALSTVAIRNRKLGMGVGITVSVASIIFYNWLALKISIPATTTDVAVAGVDTSSTNHSFVPELLFLSTSTAAALVFFLITAYIIKHKLNLN